MMTITPPHWVTSLFATAGGVAGALLAANTLPQYQQALGIVVAVCAFVAAPGLSTKPAVTATQTVTTPSGTETTTVKS